MQRILLVEDDSSIVRSLTAFLAEEGFSAASAPGERRARELLCEESFDLLLVDISLADGSGFGVCAAAKERGLPVIFLTAFGDEGSVVTGLDMGADDYIAKPFRPRELVSRIRSVLRRCGKSQASLPSIYPKPILQTPCSLSGSFDTIYLLFTSRLASLIPPILSLAVTLSLL